MEQAPIANIQHYSIHDGPGVRTTVFLQGCPLHCLWCHNPETQSLLPQLSYDLRKCLACGDCAAACTKGFLRREATGPRLLPGCDGCGDCETACVSMAISLTGKPMTVSAVFADVLRDRNFYEQGGGGLTLSGGEPLLHPTFCGALLRRCRAEGIHTAVDTCGAVPYEHFEAVLPWTDLFLYDLKHMDPDAHKALTGQSNERILENLRKLSRTGRRIYIRVPLIPGLNDSRENLAALGEFCRSLGLPDVYLLPYHDIARGKYEHLGLPYEIPRIEPPSDETMLAHQRFLQQYGCRVRIGG